MVDTSSTPFASGVSSLGLRNESEGINGGKDDDFTGYFWPYEVAYVPNSDAIPEYEGGDPLEYLSTIEASSEMPLFKVMAREDPDSELEHIGNIYLGERLFQSEFGDQSLFFQHDPFTRDAHRISKAGFKLKGAAWKSMELYRAGILPEKWDTEVDVVPDMPSDMDPKDVVEQGILGSFGCPFAWMLQ